jgi:hypothetical protein
VLAANAVVDPLGVGCGIAVPHLKDMEGAIVHAGAALDTAVAINGPLQIHTQIHIFSLYMGNRASPGGGRLLIFGLLFPRQVANLLLHALQVACL